MDNGVPQTSKRVATRPTSGGAAKAAAAAKPAGVKTAGTKTAGTKTAGAKTAGAKANGSKPGPVDPRTEDPTSPLGLSRAGKTVWRRPGALTLRTAKHRETGDADQPIEFSATLPLVPAGTIVVERESVAETEVSAIDTVSDVDAPTLLAPTIVEPEPVALVPAALVSTELVPEPRLDPVTTLSPPILYDEAATIDDVTMIGPVLDTRPLHRPVHFRRKPKPRVRRVTRVVRHVDTWSVFKVALLFNVFFYAVAMVAGVLLWQVAYATGTVDNVQKFFEGFGWATFKFNGGQIFHNAWIAGLFAAVGLTGLAVLLATLFNLITDLVGGIRFSVLEEEVHTRIQRGTEPAPTLVPQQVVETEPTTDVSALFVEPSDEAIAG